MDIGAFERTAIQTIFESSEERKKARLRAIAEKALPDPNSSLDYSGGYLHDSIVHPGQPSGGRSLEQYEELLGIPASELEGTDVLDLGSGPEGKFQTELKLRGISARVVSLSPDYSSPRHRSAFLNAANSSHEALAAVGQELPFADESFDKILCVHVLYHAPSEAIALGTISEIARVLKDGGKAIITPVPCAYIYDNRPGHEGLRRESTYTQMADNQKVVENLSSRGIQIHTETVAPGAYWARGDSASGPTGGLRIVMIKSKKFRGGSPFVSED